jgi:hypothetical protein
MATHRLAFAFVLTLGAVVTGCAADPAMTGDDDGGGDDQPPPPPPPPTPLDPTGGYTMQSTYDLTTNAPGTVGDVMRAIIDMTDSPNDPTHWLLTQMINQMPNGTLKSLLQSAEPTVADYLNQRLIDIAPDFVNTMLLVGNDFSDISKHFGLNETLVVSGGTIEGGYSAVHSAVGAHFKINNVESDYAFADYMVPNVVTNGVPITIDVPGNFGIGQHKMPIAYGKVLRIGLDAAIIPLIDPNASNLDELLEDKINCAAVGQAVADAIGFGSASTYEAACHSGLSLAADQIYSKIAAIDASLLEFDETGAAKALDTNNDKKVDKLQTGVWTGTLSYSGTPAPLASATFFGNRSN